MPRIFLVLVYLISCTAVAIASITTADFFKRSNLSGVTLSPDGKRIAYLANDNDGKISIIVAELESGKKTKLELSEAESSERYRIYIHWSTSKRLVLQVNNGHVYAVDANGKNKRQLFKSALKQSIESVEYKQPFVRDPLLDDPDHVLIQVREARTFNTSNFSSRNYDGNAQRQRLYLTWCFYKTNIHTGKKESVFCDTEDFYSVGVSRRGDINVGVKYRNARYTFFYREPGKKGWEALDEIFQDDSQSGFDLDAESATSRRCIMLGSGYLDHGFYYASNVHSDKMNIYKYNLRSQKNQIVAEAGKTYDLVSQEASYGRNNLLFSAAKKKLVGIRYEVDKRTTMWLEPYFLQIQQFLDQQLPGKLNQILEWSDDDQVFLVKSANSVDPGQYYVLNVREKSLQQVGLYSESLAQAELSQMYPISFNARDGREIHGYLTIPNAADGELLPLVVYPHGGPWVRDVYGYDGTVQFLAHHGYAVLQVNFRGSTGYGFSHFDAARLNFGDGIINDIVDGVQEMIQQKVADPNRIALMGASYGGYATMMALTRHPELFKCGVPIAGVYEVEDQLKSYRADMGRSFAYEYWQLMVGDGNSLRKISPLYKLDRLQAPVLVIHGKEDEVVSINQARNLRDALEEQKKTFEYQELDKAGHGGWSVATNTNVHNSILTFLRKQL